MPAMNDSQFANRRILLVDDNAEIHAAFAKIFRPELEGADALAKSEAALFGQTGSEIEPLVFEVDSALQGAEGLARVCAAHAEHRPYAMAFIDMRMPPGWDGIETTVRIWRQDPAIQIVICTAYTDYSWGEILDKIGGTHRDGLIILKKPFESVEVLQLANSMTAKWSLARQAACRMEDLVRMVDARTRELQLTNQQLAAETKRANEMTERAVAEAHAKSEFLAVVSHDIRNPFQAIMGCAELLKETPLDPMQREYVETIEEGGRATLTLVNDLLDVSKVAAGRLELERAEFNLAETLENLARLLAIQAHAKNVEFTVDIDPEVPEFILGDAARIRQVLLNLAGNAVKFTEHGEVTVDVSVVSTSTPEVTLRFGVRDTGIGIPADRLSGLFQAYHQADASMTRRFGGTGLGLFIVRRIVELMGGTTGVESREGLGSTFWFTAPFVSVPDSDRQRRAAVLAMNGRVLVVDDNATQRRVLVRQLQSLGLEAAGAGWANEALGILREAHAARRSFAAALVDHRMPGCDGAELSRTINSDPQLNSTRLVLLTFSGQAHEPFAACGIAACLTKPVIRQDLIDCLHLVLAASAQDWHAQTSPMITRKLLRAHRGREKRHILVAEDIPAGRRVMCRTLEHLGYRANGVANGREAVAAWESGQYHLILMDCEMPQLNGFDATRMIRSREPPGARIAIIALTGHAMPGAELECKAAGMDAYLSKPIDRERLESCLVRFLGESIDTTGVHPILLAGDTDSDDKLVDLAALRVLADGDEAFMREVLSEFLRQGSAAISELGEAVARGDASSLARTAHSLKTTAGELKAPALWQSVVRLETAVREGAAEEYARLTEQVRQDIAHALEYVRRWSACNVL